ncbi:hypothetical protein JZ751_026615 [Albula glossodonta]|uniref:Uncharacterized protein n=1 Tax=Albula glossodonta TaxID=121402 RepID=A0A8T2PGI0_9TELE|nr:hypothetical protein JZ751_026615 [Albula glossodonta]
MEQQPHHASYHKPDGSLHRPGPQPSTEKKERPVSLGLFPLPGADAVLSPELHRETVETPGTDTWRYNDLSHPRSNTSLKQNSRFLSRHTNASQAQCTEAALS